MSPFRGGVLPFTSHEGCTVRLGAYDANNSAWVHTSPEPFVFVRHSIAIAYIEADRVVLPDGPAPGTAVVIAGASELFATEFQPAS